MAMNKKEKAHIEDLKEMIEMGDILLALRLTENVPCDVPIPVGSYSDIVNGYSFNSHSMSVSESCSSSISHGWKHGETRSQNPREQYSTKLLAFKAMRHDMELLYAKNLRKIDLIIDAQSAA